jgi:hypothetical protein
MANYVVMLEIDFSEEEDYSIEHVCDLANALIHLGNVEIDGTRNISVRPLSEVLPC